MIQLYPPVATEHKIFNIVVHTSQFGETNELRAFQFAPGKFVFTDGEERNRYVDTQFGPTVTVQDILDAFATSSTDVTSISIKSL